MVLILLEALLALVLLAGLVWWTMFAGRRDGEPAGPPTDTADPVRPADPALPAAATGRTPDEPAPPT